jgi:FtsP/CotA-like multicopper oxidase with cupredoxin domain
MRLVPAVSRRALLAGMGGFAAGAFRFDPAAAQGAAPTDLSVVTRSLDVNRRSATVFGIVQANGRHGLEFNAGARFRVRLANHTNEETVIHWHGLTPPHDQDGVAGLSQPAIRPHASHDYDFPLDRPGTHWMHSHLGLQEQRLMAAPLIVRDPAEAGVDEQHVVILLHDFTFRDPEEIMAGLRPQAAGAHAGHGATPAPQAAPANPHAGHGAMMQQGPMQQVHQQMMNRMQGGHAGHGAAPAAPATGPHAGHGAAAAAVHLNDIEYDAYLANDRTLADPFAARVERGGRVRLRIINGASATNFHIDLGALNGELIAVDGNPVRPVSGRRFGVAMGQRLDIRLRLPASEGAWPVLALREGARERTGIVLATARGSITRVAPTGNAAMPAVDLELERRLVALRPLAARPADRTHRLELTGGHAAYDWSINGQMHGQHTPLPVRRGERVQIVMTNHGDMPHPMHLHGHHFQVVAIGNTTLAGAMRDTVLVPPHVQVTVAFDADNPGEWPLHCHHMYHMAAGMMTEVKYEA